MRVSDIERTINDWTSVNKYDIPVDIGWEFVNEDLGDITGDHRYKVKLLAYSGWSMIFKYFGMTYSGTWSFDELHWKIEEM